MSFSINGVQPDNCNYEYMENLQAFYAHTQQCRHCNGTARPVGEGRRCKIGMKLKARASELGGTLDDFIDKYVPGSYGDV